VVSAAVIAVPVLAAMPVLVSTIAPPGAAPFNGLQMALADFRGDGHLEAVAQSDDGGAYVADPATGVVLARFSAGTAGCTSSCYSFEGVSGPINPPAVGDVDGDGRLDVVLANTAAVVARFSFLPESSNATHFAFAKVWERRFNQFQSFTTMDAGPVLADLRGDGRLETVVSVEQRGLFAVRPDGSTLWTQDRPGTHASPTAADLDGDGRPDVVVGRDDGHVLAFTGATGALRWDFNAAAFVTPASIPAAPSVADVTGDGRPDVVFAARDAHDAQTYTNDHAMVFALDAGGHLLWRQQPPWMAPLSHTRAIVLPVHGTPKVLLGDWNTIGHVPGHFERVGPGHAFLLDGPTGHVDWVKPLDAGVSDKDFAVADVKGDGTWQAVAPGTKDSQAGLLLFDFASGGDKGFVATGQPTRSGVVVGDLFGEGKFAMIVAAQDAAGHGVLQVWRAGQVLKAPFPGWGAIRIPHGGTPNGPPPGGSGGSGGTGSGTDGPFSATFAPKGNEWWVETAVSATHAVAAVSASISGGPAQDLPPTSWGTWAKSIHAPAGSVVQFTARDGAGHAAVSGCYAWPAVTATGCPSGSSGGGTPPPSSVAFTVVNPNEWWQQVRVAAGSPPSQVQVAVAGGPWQAMTRQSYGDWTSSLHTPAGTVVAFRAVLADGAWVSEPFHWLQDNATKAGHPEGTPTPTPSPSPTSSPSPTPTSSSSSTSKPPKPHH